jgi:DNA-directed RNA polymerase I subunit RPA2
VNRPVTAMMIENMAGKAGALHGHVHDATPFKFSEDDPAIDYFGQLLEKGTISLCSANVEIQVQIQ